MVDRNFILKEWNVYDTPDRPRTNNQLEGWHNSLKRIVGKAIPIFLKSSSFFRRSRLQWKSVFSSSRQDAPSPRKAKKAITRNKRIKELRDRFVAGQSSLSDYILGISQYHFRCYFGTCLDPIFVLVLS